MPDNQPKAARPPNDLRRHLGEKPSWKARITVFKNLPAFLRLVWKTHRGLTSAIIGLRILQSLIPLAFLWIGKLIIDTVVAAAGDHVAGKAVGWTHLWQLVALEIALVSFSDILTRINAIADARFSDLFEKTVSVRLMQHAAKLDLKHFEDPEFYNHLERARRQVSASIGLFNTIITGSQNLITLVSLTSALALYIPWLFIPLILAVLPSVIGETRFATMNYMLQHRWTSKRRELEYFRNLGTSNQTVKEIKLFGLSDWFIKRYVTLTEAYDSATARLMLHQNILGWLLSSINALGYYGAYVWIIVLTVRGYHSPMGVFTIGVFTFLAATFRQSRDRIQSALMTVSQLYVRALYLHDLFAFFDMQPSIFSLPTARHIPRPIVRGFEFRDVGFRYQGSNHWAVRHLSFTLDPEQRIALVGENGAGKTTVVKLITRLYDPDEGTILLDGVDLREYNIASLHQAAGVIFQDFIRYDLLLRENIGVGQINAIDNQPLIEAAAQRSLASELASQMKEGYNQMLGRRFENGVELSGGEWQKVALARAYLRDSQLLILDEPTAALDARAESKLFQRFAELTKGKMAVLISHRFSTVRMADKILVLDQGNLIEMGTHMELMAKRGRYAELFELQATGYK